MSPRSSAAKRPPGGAVTAPSRRANGAIDAATRQKVVEAAVACILERGFYRASSNEIARRAGVTWGVIQHYFGTRQALMLAVLHHGSSQFSELVESASIGGDTVEERITQLLDLLATHYGRPEYLAYMQVQLNLDHDPRTSAEVRATIRAVAERSNEHVRRLLRETLGRATAVPDLSTTLFLVLRGFVVSQQLLDSMTYDLVAPGTDRVARQRRLLAEALAPFLQARTPTP